MLVWDMLKCYLVIYIIICYSFAWMVDQTVGTEYTKYNYKKVINFNYREYDYFYFNQWYNKLNL